MLLFQEVNGSDFFLISWRLITSQHCSGFCHTLTWISHGFTCVPHPDSPPTSLSTRFLWVFPVHQARALVSCIPPGLVICFTIDNIHAVPLKHPTLQRQGIFVCPVLWCSPHIQSCVWHSVSIPYLLKEWKVKSVNTYQILDFTELWFFFFCINKNKNIHV